MLSKVEVQNISAFVSGIIVLVLASAVTLRALHYYKKFETRLAKRLAFMTFLSSTLSILGSVGVIVDALTERNLWYIMASFFTASYVLITAAVFIYMRLIYTAFGGEMETPEIQVSGGGERRDLPVGGYLITKEDLERVRVLCKKASGSMYIGRNSSPTYCNFDRVLWLTRLETEGAVDPAKLHVIQGAVIKFINERKGGVLVVLDGLEYLIIHNDFKGIMKFLTALKDYMTISGSLLLIVIKEKTLDRKECSIITREFPKVDLEQLLLEVEEKALFGAITKEELNET